MKKINYLFYLTILALTFQTCTQAQTVQSAYQTYLNKLRVCSPYTYNVDGDPTITTIVGRYNRRCIIRSFTYANATECSFKNDELKTYVKALPSAKVYAQNLNKPTSEMSSKDAKIYSNLISVNEILKTNGTCVTSNDSNENGN